MAIQKIDAHEVKITSKLIDIWLRPHAIYVTRILHKDMHHPLTPFVIKAGLIIPAIPSKIKVVNNSVLFEAEGVSGNISFQGENCISIHMTSYGCQVGVMWPSEGLCYFADEMHPIDQRFSSCSQSDPSDDPTVTKLHLPYVSQTTPDCCLSVVSEQTPIAFNSFNHNFSPCLNAIAAESISLDFRSFLSRKESLVDYQRRFGEKKRKQEDLSFEGMKQALYHNSVIVPKHDNPKIIEQAQKIQSALDRHKIYNCLIGSLAMHLHGLAASPNDADFAVHSLASTKELFPNASESKSDKWSQCAIRVQQAQGHIDFVELHQFPWDQVEEIDGLHVLSTDGLFRMKLIGEHERSLIYPNYEVMKKNNQANIAALLDKHPDFLYPFFREFLLKHSIDKFQSLMKLLEKAEWDAVGISVNSPFIVNAYKKVEQTIIPIINGGSSQPARVLVDRVLKDAQLYDIGELPEECKVHYGSIITPPVQSFGIIVCRNG